MTSGRHDIKPTDVLRPTMAATPSALRFMVILALLSVAALSACEAFSDIDTIPRPVCVADQDCDDEVFCNGLERCDPQDDAADSFGCVQSSVEALVDDGVECTIDACDEEGRVVRHDPSNCDCVSDAQCDALLGGPCVALAACDPQSFTCTVTLAEEGTPCDDGVDCTLNTACDNAGACLGARADAACDDGVFCNGVERCEPDDDAADPLTGCIHGASPVGDPELDDGVECTVTACDEALDVLIHSPTAACECVGPEDCFDGTCQNFRCDAGTGFTCQLNLEEPLRPIGAQCDDGVRCTDGDVCVDEGRCLGQPVNSLCEDSDARCAPGDPDASPVDGCL